MKVTENKYWQCQCGKSNDTTHNPKSCWCCGKPKK